MYQAAVLFVILCLPSSTRSSSKTLVQLLEEKERLVRGLAEDAERQFASRCALSSLDCTGSNYLGCESEFPGATCTKRYSDPACSCKGMMVDHSVSDLWIPQTARDKFDTTVIDQICYTQSLVPLWIQNSRAYSWADSQSFGAWNGVYRIHPALLIQKCGSYDPRFRPWFVAGSSGPKDVIIVVDTSGSMRTAGRMDLAKQATKTVLSTLTIADHVGVVSFETTASSVNGPILKQATAANLAVLNNKVDGLVANGGTNFEQGFRTAFDMFTQSATQDGTSNCNKAILFLTDGVPTNGITDATQLATLVRTLNANQNAFIFTYSLGSGADTTIMKNIACANRGVFQAVLDGSDLRSDMALFYDVFATGMSGVVLDANGQPQPRFTAWVEPYDFIGGGGVGTTVSAPVYDNSTNPPTLIGVVANDMTIADMQKVEPNPDQLLKAFTLRASRCPKLNLTECQLESIRARFQSLNARVSSTCGTCTNFTNTHPQPCSHGMYPVRAQLWKPKSTKTWSQRACCPNCTAVTAAAVRVDLACSFFVVAVMLSYFSG